MQVNAEYMSELLGLYPHAKEYSEGGMLYIHLPKFLLPDGQEVEALVLLSGSAPYTTRLFLPNPVSGKGANWTQHHILNKVWWTWSWRDVPSESRYVEILANHVSALR